MKIRKFLKGSYWSPTWISAILNRYYGKQIWVDSMGWEMGYIEMFHPYHEFTFNHECLFINFTEIKNRLLRNTKRIQNGYFSLKRTKKWFSRLPVGLTLEQTTNTDVAGKRIGISAITNSISACQRWAEIHHIRL